MEGREACHSHSGEKVGRPSALTPEVHERIVRAKGVGAPDWAAAQLAGISPTTYYELTKKGREEEAGPHGQLVEAIASAEAEHYVYAMATLKQAMSRDWRAALAVADRVDRKRARQDERAAAEPAAVPSPDERRLDPSKLSTKQLNHLEALYAITEAREKRQGK
jgi:hypothetical protein